MQTPHYTNLGAIGADGHGARVLAEHRDRLDQLMRRNTIDID